MAVFMYRTERLDPPDAGMVEEAGAPSDAALQALKLIVAARGDVVYPFPFDIFVKGGGFDELHFEADGPDAVVMLSEV